MGRFCLHAQKAAGAIIGILPASVGRMQIAPYVENTDEDELRGAYADEDELRDEYADEDELRGACGDEDELRGA